MKYLRLNIQLLFAFVLMLGLFSCTDEDAVGNGKKEIKEGLPTTVTLKLTSATPMVVETKTADDGGKFGVINDLAILVYKTETGELDKVTCVSNVNAKEWNGSFNATTGSRRVYVLANSGLGEAGIKSDYSQESDLLTSGLIDAGTTTPVGNERMLGFVHTVNDFEKELSSKENSETIDIPESNGSTPVVSLYSRLYPPYSKITFTVKNEVKTDMSEKVQLNITNVYVRNLPTKYSLLPEKNILKTSGLSGTDVFSEKVQQMSKEEDVYEFYMYENLQGTINEGNSNPKLKSPFQGEYPSNNSNPSENYESWNTKWATKTPCTYIEVEGTYAIWKSDTQYGAGKIHYRFFLGANTVDNFDIKRNTHYKVELAFTETAGYDELSYEWRVNAQLNDVTIVPEGILEIDGSPDFYFPFYVINNTGSKTTIDTDYDESNMMIRYKDGWGIWQQASDLGDNVPTNGVLNCDIHSIDFGILGAPGHNDKQQAENIYTNEDTGAIYTSHGGDDEAYPDNITFRGGVGAGKIYRKRKFTVNSDKILTVKEYPLLCLYESTEIGSKKTNTVYAQRIDRSDENGKKLFSESEAKSTCSGYSGKAYMNKSLPTTSDLLKMIEYEKYFVPKANSLYWTTDGLYSWTDSKELVRSSENQGYVRCVYKH